MYNVQASRFIFCHFFKSLAYSFEGPFRRAYFNFENYFCIPPNLRLLKQNIHISSIWRVPVYVHTTFYLFQKFFGKRLLLPLALYPFGIPWFVSLSLFQERNTPTTLVYTGLFANILHRLPRCAFFLHELIPLPLHQGCLSFCYQIFVCNTADTNKLAVSDSAPSSTTTEANCQKLRALSLQRLSHQNIGFLLDADRAWHETYFFCFIPAQVQDITHIILRFFGFYPKHLLFWTSNLFTLFTQRIYLSTLFISRHMTQRHTQTRTHTHHTHTHAHRMQEQDKRRNEDEREKRPL